MTPDKGRLVCYRKKGTSEWKTSRCVEAGEGRDRPAIRSHSAVLEQRPELQLEEEEVTVRYLTYCRESNFPLHILSLYPLCRCPEPCPFNQDAEPISPSPHLPDRRDQGPRRR